MPVEECLTSAYRSIKLEALLDAPSAFGSTYARELLFTNDEWLQRSKSFNGDTKILFLALDAGQPCGLIGSVLDETDPSKADVISMWVAPSHRRSGLGSALLDTVLDWARARGVGTLRLNVTSSNDAAIAFYQRYGFVKTGRTEPYPNDPALLEFEMMRPITA